MVKINYIVGLLSLVSFNLAAQKELKSVFPVKWSTKIGVTTYRTNMVLHEGKIFIGSNGKDRNFKNDDVDGVYEIDAKSGKILYHYEIPFAGDNDVNGVAIGDGKLFFGTDNYYFFCFDIATKKELWKYNLPYDVESCPQLADLNGDGKQDVAFNVEGNYFYALNGKNGELLWENNSITAHSGNSSPLKYDINGDGVPDFLTSGRGNPESEELAGFKMAHYGDYNLAIDGKTGKTLWAVATGAGVHASPYLNQTSAGPEFIFLDSYGQLSVIDKSGKLLKQLEFGYGNYSSPTISKDNYLVVGNGAISLDEKNFYVDEVTGVKYLQENVNAKSTDINGAISATTMIADVLAKNLDQIIGVNEEGLVFISKTNGEQIHLFKIPAGAEASVFIADIDGDKFLEILIADLAGNLTCYKTKSKSKPTRGSFR